VSEPFRLLLRVRYAECDLQGIVFNARWGDYVDIATAEYSRVLFGGVDPAETGLDWRLVKYTIAWHAPAHYDDVLTIRTTVTRTSPIRIEHKYEVIRDGTLLAEGFSTLACVGRDGKLREMPAWLSGEG